MSYICVFFVYLYNSDVCFHNFRNFYVINSDYFLIESWYFNSYHIHYHYLDIMDLSQAEVTA